MKYQKTIIGFLTYALCLGFIQQTIYAEALIGKISKEEEIQRGNCQVLDARTNTPISNALISIPKENIINQIYPEADPEPSAQPLQRLHSS